ncbi:MAG: bifunctional (p)ppGpp synthetase/guanosine-3',5'-bis(diphosphate) 3'-pyrophosphohydrolase [Chlorobiales bacterium]|nr:bifunctional (p)ppGpp synthetase/guanosine-3',5'-bis(diphosphate) 3'-pyrophosphohydrolase [Chlorobiales bacterium]
MLAQIEEEHYVKLNEILELCRLRLKTYDESLIRRAFFLCYRAHSQEKRASGEPFFYHPVEVAKILLTEIPLDDVSVVAALLHDVVEDTDYTYDDLKEEFGDEVASIVAGLTKISGIFDNREIKEAESFRKMLLSMIHDIRVILIKFCDRLHNMRTLDALPPHRQIKIAIETRDIYAPFAHRFGLSKIKIELENLALKYIDRDAFDSLTEQLKMTRAEREKYLERVMEPIRIELRKHDFKFEVYGRPKHLFSIYTKMRYQGKAFDEIYDIYGIRVILDSENSSDCFAAYGYITQLFPPVPERFKDYISVPKHNGYQSLHTTILGPGGRMIEAQIRTRRMHEFAENGIAAHWRYKERVSKHDQAIDQMLKWAKELIEDSDSAASFMEGFKLNLYHDEIYVFTPKGDMKVLPFSATPVDFAFEIHTEVGMKCIGAKVNGKIVALHARLKSGDQVEIITSKNQRPKSDWEKFVVTHKAKVKIKQSVNEERRKQIEEGRSIWNKLVSKTKKILKDNEIIKMTKGLGVNTPADFFRGLASNEIDGEALLKKYENKDQDGKQREGKSNEAIYDKFLTEARQSNKEITVSVSGDVVIEGLGNIAYSYAKCCNPVPGDDVIGFVTAAQGVRIHRMNCPNITNDKILKSEKLVNVDWRKGNNSQFLAALKIFGQDKIGITNNITQVILKSDINIRGITLNAKDGMFEGAVVVFIKDVDALNKLVEKIKKVDGVFSVERLSSN